MSIYLKYSFGVLKTRELTVVLNTHNSEPKTLLPFSALRLRSV